MGMKNIMASLSRITLTLLLCYHALVSADTLPSGYSKNATPLSNPINYSRPGPAIPPAPPDFRTEFHYDTSIKISPLGVYLTAIKLMWNLSKQPWYDQVELSETSLFAVMQGRVILCSTDRPANKGLTTGLLARALYYLVSSMSEGQPGFVQITSTMLLGEKIIGTLFMAKDSLSVGPSDGSDYLTNVTSTPALNGTLMADSGEVIDPDDQMLKIAYQYDRINVPNQEIFSAALDGITTAAQYDTGTSCGSITAVSFSGTTTFHIGVAQGQTLLGSQISRAYYLLVQLLFLKQRRFEEIEFDLVVDGNKIATGFVLRLSVGAINWTHVIASQ